MMNNLFGTATFQPNALSVISTVHGKDVALSYPSQIGSVSYFLDDSEPYLYKKRVDNSGNIVEFRTFELKEKEEPKPQQINTSDFATKADFAALCSTVEELKALVVNNHSNGNSKQNFVPKKGNNHESSSR